MAIEERERRIARRVLMEEIVPSLGGQGDSRSRQGCSFRRGLDAKAQRRKGLKEWGIAVCMVIADNRRAIRSRLINVPLRLGALALKGPWESLPPYDVPLPI
jgi:hypothetical protein